MQDLRERGRGAIAVTIHHDQDFVAKVKLIQHAEHIAHLIRNDLGLAIGRYDYREIGWVRHV